MSFIAHITSYTAVSFVIYFNTTLGTNTGHQVSLSGWGEGVRDNKGCHLDSKCEYLLTAVISRKKLLESSLREISE